jgi:mRNA interferase RelE/StbE
MPDYEIRITKTAQKQLDKLPGSVAGILFDTILSLADNPRPFGCKKLKGRDGYRIRKGNYRVLYDIYDKVLVIEVIAIGNRKDIYE